MNNSTQIPVEEAHALGLGTRLSEFHFEEVHGLLTAPCEVTTTKDDGTHVQKLIRRGELLDVLMGEIQSTEAHISVLGELIQKSREERATAEVAAAAERKKLANELAMRIDVRAQESHQRTLWTIGIGVAACVLAGGSWLASYRQAQERERASWFLPQSPPQQQQPPEPPAATPPSTGQNDTLLREIQAMREEMTGLRRKADVTGQLVLDMRQQTPAPAPVPPFYGGYPMMMPTPPQAPATPPDEVF